MSACPLVDCHTHTSFSDGHASFEDNVRAAAAAGCRAMVSTDHLTLPASMDSNCEVQVVEGDLPAHRLAFEDARKLAAQIAPELELIYGFECDWYEGCEPLVERWSAGAAVRLGSVHWIGDPGDIMAGAAGTAGTKDVARPDTPDSRCGWIDDYYPATGLLRCFAHAEVPITFGSDAHRACDICWNIREAQAHAYDCGYRTFDIPHLTGEWESTPLD